MKQYILSFLLLAVCVPAMLSMDDGQAARQPNAPKQNPSIIFTLLMDRKSDPAAIAWHIEHICHEQHLDLNMAKKVSDRYGTRITPPLAAVFEISSAIIETLISHGADVNATVYQKDNGSDLYKPMLLLTWFVNSYIKRDASKLIEDKDKIRLLIARGADTDKCCKECFGSLSHLKTIAGALPLIIHILRAKKDQFSQLIDAIDRGDLEEIATLCTINKKLVNHRDEFGFTPLGYACGLGRGKGDMVRALLSLEAHCQDALFVNPDDGVADGNALTRACQYHWDDVIEILAGQGARLQQATDDQELLRMLIKEDFECSGCFKKAAQIAQLQGLACGHIFCANCIKKLPNKQCPLCRAPIR